jgi:23S rRNA (cytidine1920-2'-O)/16S rRNA (cytidine1409-2'-O)-methyltransferase
MDAFALDPAAMTCADLGCSTGGFTDCLLQAGASRVFAVDTAYGQLAWKLRTDPRVVVIERSNALHAEPPEGPICALVVIDLGWTPQRLALPAARTWLAPAGRILTLIKPHYEVEKSALPPGGVLDEPEAERIARAVYESLPAMGFRALGLTRSPVLGGAASRKKSKGSGNAEWLALLAIE